MTNIDDAISRLELQLKRTSDAKNIRYLTTSLLRLEQIKTIREERDKDGK